jgi:hypothetical protein
MVGLAVLGVVVVLRRTPRKEWPQPFIILVLFISSTIATTAFYTSTVFNHYVLFIVPMVCLFYGYLLWYVTKDLKYTVSVPLIFLVVTGFIYINLSPLPFFKPQTPAIDIYHQAAQDALVHLPDGTYNMVLLSTQRDFYGLNYRYFFETSTRPPAAQDTYANLDYLVVIDELGVNNPLTANSYEIMIANPKILLGQFKTNQQTTIWIYSVQNDESLGKI